MGNWCIVLGFFYPLPPVCIASVVRTWFSGGPGCAGLMVGLDDLGSLFQGELVCDSLFLLSLFLYQIQKTNRHSHLCSTTDTHLHPLFMPK